MQPVRFFIIDIYFNSSGAAVEGVILCMNSFGLPKNLIQLVFESPVRSGLLVPSALDRNRNRSSQFQKLPKTGPNRDRPVFCGYKTGFNRLWS